MKVLDPVARHADLETASIPTELDFGRYRHAQEVTDFYEHRNR